VWFELLVVDIGGVTVQFYVSFTYLPCLLACDSPYLDNSATSQRSAQPPPRNKFDAVENTFSPAALPIWRQALKDLGDEISPTDVPKPLPGLNLGYWYPEHGMLISLQNDEIIVTYLTFWLHLKELMLYRVSHPSLSGQILAKAWKTMFSLCLPRRGSSRSAHQENTNEILQTLSTHFAAEPLDVDHIMKLSPEWDRWELSVKDVREEAKSIAWEISKLNFRHNFLSLDAIMHVETEMSSQASFKHRRFMHELRISTIHHNCWPSTAIDVNRTQIQEGIGSNDMSERCFRVGRLWAAMETWREASMFVTLSVLRYSTKLGWTDEMTRELEAFEKQVAAFYVRAFYAVFGRAASIPHVV
jgi:hypothetical protein